MKKYGLFKKIGLSATTACLCLSMLAAGSAALVDLPSGAAAEESAATGPAVGALAKDVTSKDSYYYGETIEVIGTAFGGAVRKVTAPGGQAVELDSNNKFVANQLGVYKINYSKSGVEYNYNVNVSLKEDYFLHVDYNGADIPTYIEKGKEIKLPKASVKYFDENSVLKAYPGTAVIEIKDSKGNVYDSADPVFKTNDLDGKVFITYSAKLEVKGTKYLSKTFAVNIQSKVSSGGNPTCAVSGVTKSASVNRPITLPKATVSDKNDDNIKVIIEVKDPDGKNVKNVNVNDDGYVSEELADDVVFDNDKSMTFYPTKEGKYKVLYTAYNDFGGKSGTNESIIEVSDLVAPVFKNTDKYEYLIPETWGMNVKDESNKSPKDGDVDMSGKIKLVVPEIVDNKDKNDDLSLYFRITDADNNKTILSIDNILATEGEKCQYKKGSSGLYDEETVTFNRENPFYFDFGKYKKTNSSDEEQTKPGTYTVYFRARDKANNTSSKSYTVTLKENFDDLAKPSTAEVTVPDYLSVADETLTIPAPVYADAIDTRPQVIYRIYTDANTGSNANWISVKGGEQAKIETESSDRYLVIDESKKLKLGSALYFYVGVVDKAGNFRSNAVDDDKSFIKLNETNDARYQKISARTEIIGASAGSGFVYSENVAFVKAGGGNVITAGDNVNAGKFKIEVADKKMRYYTGFEVAVRDPQGNHVDVSLETVSRDVENKAEIYVQNIRFNAAVATASDEYYTMTVRVFDVNGKSEVYGYKFGGVRQATGGNGQTSAIPTIGSTGNVKVDYKLNNAVIKGIPGDSGKVYRVVRKISGGIFSLMGNEFTAYTAGSYSVQDGYIDNGAIDADGAFDYDNVKFSGANKGMYGFNVVNTAKPVIELLGAMPNYSEKGVDVLIPQAIAYTENGMGEIKVDIVDPDGVNVDDWKKDENKFKPTKDGAYTVTYSATYENGEKDSKSFTVNVGDVFPPKFGFVANSGTSVSGTKSEGTEFKFKKLELLDGEKPSGVTITKEIYDPSHELMSSNTVSGSFSSYADKENNGSTINLNKVGEYTIVYTAKDAVGNEYKLTETLTVTSKGTSTPTTWTTLSTVLIIVAIVLLAGVIVYVVRFRKIKK